MTTVLVFRSTERISSVAETWPLRMANRKSLAARAEAPSRTPSLSNAETFAVTSRLNVFAARPDPWPSAMMTDIPPPGRSTISTVSPLSRDAYLLVLATATSIVSGMTAAQSLILTHRRFDPHRIREARSPHCQSVWLRRLERRSEAARHGAGTAGPQASCRQQARDSPP